MTAKVFLSHSSRDKDAVRRLAHDLQAADVDVWLDEWEILVGDRITQKIQEGLRNCDFLAVWLTRHAIDSGWVEREWQAKYHDEVSDGTVAVLPLLAEHFDMPPLLRDKKYADFRTDYTAGLDELLRVFSRPSQRSRSALPGRSDLLLNVSTLNEGDDDQISRHFNAEEDLLLLRYKPKKVGQSLQIVPRMPYLESLESGGPISGLSYWWSPFEWQFPNLDLKILNNSKETVFLTELVLDVGTSRLDPWPVLLIEENLYNVRHFCVINEGWGDIKNCSIRFNIAFRGEVPDYDGTLTHQVNLGDFADSYNVDITSHLAEIGLTPGPRRRPWEDQPYGGPGVVLVYGVVEFGGLRVDGIYAKAAVKFSTHVSLFEPGPGAPAPPSYQYHVMLDVNKDSYQVKVPVSHVIKPQEADRFCLRVGAPKSSVHKLRLKVIYNNLEELTSEPISLSLFLPKSQADRLRQGKREVEPHVTPHNQSLNRSGGQHSI